MGVLKIYVSLENFSLAFHISVTHLPFTVATEIIFRGQGLGNNLFLRWIQGIKQCNINTMFQGTQG